MKTGRFISSRIDFRGSTAVAAITVSFLIIIISVAVSSGFRYEIRRAVSETAGDIQVHPDGALTATAIDDILSVGGVESATPVAYAGGMVKSGDVIQGVMVKGIPRPDSMALSVSIPEKLATALDLKPGDPLITYFAADKVKIRKFTVSDIYSSTCYISDDEALTIIAPISDIRKVAGMGSDECSLIEVRLQDKFRNPTDMRSKAGEITVSSGLWSESTADRYSHLFSWLEVIDANVLVILILLSIVAGFNMISGLLIMLFRNISTIGTLKTLGMNDRAIAGIFLRVASRTTLMGMAAGNALALLFCLIQGSTGLLRLDPSNYFVSVVPVRLNLPLMIAADIAAYLVIMLLELLPTLFISKVDPAQNVRVK